MKFRTLISYVFALAAASFLAACGGGGASGNPNQGGPISVSPESGIFYAGIASTITLSGGRKPYAITSSDPAVLPVPPIVNDNSFQVVPNNPGVIDTGIPEGGLPVRTVTVSIRDSTGIQVTSTIQVARNFLTGYGFAILNSTCTSAQVCVGNETAIQITSITNGSLFGNRTFRLERVRGDFLFADPVSSNNFVPAINVASDHQGKIIAILKATPGAPSQVAIFRVIDVASGASSEYAFTIGQSATTSPTLTPIPTSLTFTGPNDQTCGTGSADVLVFDGQPPYTAVSTDPNVSVTPRSDSNPGVFRVSANNPFVCLSAVPVVFTDARGGRATITVTTAKGDTAVPGPTPVAASPDTMTLACGTTGSATVVGGRGNYSATSTHPRVTATVSGNTIAISRLAPDVAPPAGGYPTTATITVTDGSTTDTIVVTVPGTC